MEGKEHPESSEFDSVKLLSAGKPWRCSWRTMSMVFEESLKKRGSRRLNTGKKHSIQERELKETVEEDHMLHTHYSLKSLMQIFL